MASSNLLAEFDGAKIKWLEVENDLFATVEGKATDSLFAGMNPICDIGANIIPSLPQFSVLCPGEMLTLTAEPVGGVPPFTYVWSTGETTSVISIPNPGLFGTNYGLTITDDNGCTGTELAHLKYQEWTANLTIEPGVQCIGETTTLTAQLFPIYSGSTFEWSTGENTETITISANGTYSVTITNPNMPCPSVTNSIDVSVFVPVPQPNPVITGTTTLCAGQNGLLTATGGPFDSYVWFPTYASDNENLPITDPGLYIVFVQNAAGCEGIDSFEVVSGGIPPELNSPNPICFGQNSTVEVLNASQFVDFQWDNGGVGPSITVSAAGTYTVTVTMSGGCTATGSAEVLEISSDLSISGSVTNLSSCFSPNGAININVSPTGSYDFIWSNGATTEDITGLAAGTYMVTVSEPGGCSATESFTVLDDLTPPTLTANPTPAICGLNNGTIDITVSPAGSYDFDWSNGSSSEDISNLAPGTYTVTATSTTTGCTATVSATVLNSNESITISGDITPMTFCLPFNGEVDITVSPTGNYTYAWSNGDSNEDISNLQAGGYVVTVSAGGNCTASATFNVPNESQLPAMNLATFPATCGESNGSINLTPSPSGDYSFQWSNGATTEDISNLPAGLYSVTLTVVSTGCTASSTINIINLGPNFNIIGNAWPLTSCASPNGAIYITVSPPNNYDFIWSNGANTEDITDLEAGQYSVVVLLGPSCSTTASFTVPDNTEIPTVNAATTPTACGQDEGEIDITVSPTGSYDFAWSNGATTEDLTNIAAGTYTVTVTATATGCTATASATVQSSGSNIAITGNSTPVTSCTAPNGTVDITPSPTGAYTFAWSSGASTEDLTNIAAGSYTVTVSAGGNCTASASFTVENNATPPAMNLLVTPATCGQNNGEIDLTISSSGTYAFNWSNGASTEDLTNLAPDSYEVTVTSSTTGCTATESATVQNSGFIPNITGIANPNTSCTVSNGSINTSVSPSSSYDYSWSNGANTLNIENLAAATYTVTVSAGGNCIGSASFIVEENASLPSLAANVTAAVCGDPIGAIDLSVAPAGNYVFGWSNGASTEDLTGLAPGNYTVIATVTVTSCTATATFNVPNNSSSFTLTGSASPLTNCGAPNGQVNLNVSPSGIYSFLWSNGEMTEDLQNLAAGSYTVTVTQAGACTGEASFQVLSQVVLPLLAQNSSPASCGQSNGSVDLSVTQASGNSYIWSNPTGASGATTEDLQNVPAGNYTVTVTSANGCTASASATVLENSTAITLTGSATANTSCTGANGSIDLTASPSGVYDYIWSNPSGAGGANTEDLQNLAAGTYTVTVSAGGNCTSTASFTVPNNSGAPDLTTAVTPATCGQSNGSIDLTASPSGVYGFVWSVGETTEDLQNFPAGSYTVTCTGANGCTSSTTVSVPNNNISFTLTTIVTPSSSCLSANGGIDLSVSPAGTYGFLWSNPTGASGATTEDLQNIAAGNYSVTVADANGCSDIASVTVAGPTAPQVAVVGPTAACAGASVSLSASAGFVDYLWSNGMTGQGITVSQPATYAVTATDANGCTAIASQPFSNLPQPTPVISGPSSICVSSTQFTVSGGVFNQINWSTGETTTSIIVSQSDNYTVTVTDANGCTASDSQSLSIGTSLQPSIATATACDGTATLDAGQGYASYLWSNGGDLQILSVNASGTYAVTVSDGTGCTGETSAQISIPAPPQVAITGANSICQGSSTQFSVPNNFTQINWSTGAVTPSITVSQPATYGVTVTAANGCTASASQTLSVGAGLSPDITAMMTDCNGSTSLDAGLGYASYLWSNGSNLPAITVSANGNFTVTVTDASGCSGTASETVTIPTPPLVQVLGASQICEGETSVLAAPGNFVQYLWSTGDTTLQIVITQGGTYAVTVSDANGCTASDQWTVAQLQADFTLLQTTACSPLDTGTVTTVLTNQLGCDSVVVISTVLAQPIFTQIQLSACEGGSAVFNGVNLSVGSTQDFVFAAANGCDSTVSVSVMAFPAISFELESVAACQDSPNGSIAILMLGGEQPYQFSLNGGAYQTDTLFADLPSGNYTVAAQDGNGCVLPEIVNIPAIPPMLVKVEDETLVCGETVLLEPLVVSSLDVDWAWLDSSGVVSTADRLQVNSPGTYFFSMTNACETFSGEISVEVEPLKQSKLIYLPNSFSPNDDGLNDCYQVYVDPELELLSYELQIFDRWGDQIFVTTDVEGCWDGWFRGKPMDTAVMVYWVKMLVQHCDGQVVEVFRKGDVHLVR